MTPPRNCVGILTPTESNIKLCFHSTSHESGDFYTCRYAFGTNKHLLKQVKILTKSKILETNTCFLRIHYCTHYSGRYVMGNTKRIAIIGGTGKVGRHIAAKALQNGYQVRMLVRNPSKLTYNDERIEIVVGDVQNLDALHTLLKGCQVVINTFGQPVNDMPIYSKVTENILEVMKAFHIERYIGVTGGSLTIIGDKKSFINRIGAKLFEILYSKMIADKKKEWQLLHQNKLINWTLIRLPFISESLEVSYIKESLVDMPGTKITNQDIATFITHQIEDQKYFHQAPFISN